MGSIPIHEIAMGCNDRIKQFYWKLWYGDEEVLPEIDIRDKFCAVVGNQGESFETARNTEVKAPMDFSIVTGWQVSAHILSFAYAFSFLIYRPS